MIPSLLVSLKGWYWYYDGNGRQKPLQAIDKKYILCSAMVFILNGCPFHYAHVWCKIGIFREKKIGFDYSFDVTKCLQQIEITVLLHIFS